MKNFRKIFNEGLNADDDFSVISKGQWVNAENIRTFTTDNGATGRIENVWGNISLFNELPDGINRCIGGCEDEAKKRILWFNWNSAGDHGIYCFDKTLAAGYKVLMSADVDGGLNFARFAYIHSCFIANGNLYWVNGNQNQPRRLNIEAGIKLYDSTFTTTQNPYLTPLSQSIISWIRRPGAFPPIALKAVQDSIDYNYLKDGAFQFCYRYNFRDNEFSTLSALSDLCDYNADKETFNKIDVSIPFAETIEQDVSTIDLVVRNVVDDSYFIIKTWDSVTDADAIAAHNAGTQELTYDFFNANTGEALDSAYKVKPFDSFPIYAETTELAKNRSFVGNYTEGYATPKDTSLRVNINFETVGTSVVDTVLGKWYKDDFKLQPGGTHYTNYVIQTDTPFHSSIPYSPVYYWEVAGSTVPPYPGTLDYTDLTYIGNWTGAISDYFRAKDGHNSGNSTVHDHTTVYMNQTTAISTDDSSVTSLGKCFKSGSSLEIGITFYDEYQRKCGVKKMTNAIVTTTVVLPQAAYPITTAGLTDITVTGIDASTVLVGDILQVVDNIYGIAGSYVIQSITHSGSTYTFVTDRNFGILVSATVFIGFLRFTTQGTVIGIPDYKLTNKYATYITWSLDITNPLTEIPDWAFYYSIDVTKCLSTRFFFDGAGLMSYANRDKTTGLFTLETGFTDSSFLLIDTAGIEVFGMGYTFAEGDIAKIIIGSNEYMTAVTGAEGGYITVQPVDVGTLSPTMGIFEIFTPYKQSVTEPFFETGDMFAIVNPTTSDRNYGTYSGQIGGDVYLLQRVYSSANFVAEAMSPNDKYWQQWNTNTGRPNAIDTIGQVTKTGGRRFSNTFIEGSKVNGLSSFEALNEDILDIENGAIRKLQLANKVQIDGTVMLNICENETVSSYLGEQEMFDTQGSAFIAKANSVIGSSKALKGSKGTRNPESVFEYNGLVVFWDTQNGCAVQYSDNGLFAISKNKLTRAASLLSKKIISLSQQDIFELGSDPFIVGGVDPYHKEFLFSIPTTEATPPKGFLEDYTDVAYPYDIYDGRGKVLVYKSEVDMWFGSMGFEAEKFIRMDNDLYSFKEGALYIHNQVGSTSFYGVPFKSRLMYSNNPGAIHTFLSVGLESNKKPSWVHLRTEDPYVQSSDLLPGDFTVKEGVISTSLLRDRLSPNSSGDYNKKQVTGDKLFGKALLVMLEYEFESDTTPLQLRVSNVGNVVRQGTLINQQ